MERGDADAVVGGEISLLVPPRIVGSSLEKVAPVPGGRAGAVGHVDERQGPHEGRDVDLRRRALALVERGPHRHPAEVDRDRIGCGADVIRRRIPQKRQH